LIGENIIFFNNTAADEKGGAIYSSGSKTTLFNITFTQNVAKDKGGCIYSSDNSAFSCN
jgi:predicted outer membrane repeat protein